MVAGGEGVVVVVVSYLSLSQLLCIFLLCLLPLLLDDREVGNTHHTYVIRALQALFLFLKGGIVAFDYVFELG